MPRCWSHAKDWLYQFVGAAGLGIFLKPVIFRGIRRLRPGQWQGLMDLYYTHGCE